MDNDLRKEALRKAAIKANHGKKVVIPSVAPIYPFAIEREYRKLANEYISCVKTVFLKHFGQQGKNRQYQRPGLPCRYPHGIC